MVVWFTWTAEEARHLGVGDPCCTGSESVTEKPERLEQLQAVITELGFPAVGQLSQGQMYPCRE